MNIAAREPIALRELRQAARQRRVPLLVGGLPLALLCLGMLVAATMGTYSEPAAIGSSMFETFFGFATCVVVVTGATVAASGIASEREGNTWEALLLSGLRPGAIARSKLASAFLQASLYLLVLAPGAALAFVFGGVPLLELGVSFVLLLAVAALAVAFGLAVSSYARSARGALAGALIATVIVGPTMYGIFSTSGMILADELHDETLHGATWLARAIANAPLTLRTALFLVVDPLLVLALPGTFLLEVTKANLSDANADRSTGLRRWYLVATLVLVLGACATNVAVRATGAEVTVLFVLIVALHLGFGTLVFGAEPLGPSRRVEAGWARSGGATLARRILGPGIGAATVLHAVVGAASLLCVYLVGRSFQDRHVLYLGLATGYAVGFHLFLAGASGLLVARTERAVVARVAVGLGALVLAVGPLLAGSILRVATGEHDGQVLASLSPLFLLTTGTLSPDPSAVSAATFASTTYGVVGAGLVALAFVTARRRLR